MNQLVFIENGQPVTDTLTVAEAFDKNHADVLRDIRNLGCSKEFRLSNFAESYYANNQGRQMPRFVLTEQGFTLLVMGYTGSSAMEFKERYISEFHRMREELSKKQVQALPQSYKAALLQLVAQVEENEKLQAQISTDRPKVIFAEALETSTNAILIGELAKLLKQNGVGIGQNRLFQKLRTEGYLGTRGEYYNMPTQKAMELKLFQIKTRSINNPDGSVRVTKTTKVTGKGMVYFINKFKRAN